jgi:hypothetical protein
VDFAGKMLVAAQVDGEGLTEEELKLFKVRRKILLLVGLENAGVTSCIN